MDNIHILKNFHLGQALTSEHALRRSKGASARSGSVNERIPIKEAGNLNSDEPTSIKDSLKQFLTNKLVREYRSANLPQELKAKIIDNIKQLVNYHVN